MTRKTFRLPPAGMMLRAAPGHQGVVHRSVLPRPTLCRREAALASLSLALFGARPAVASPDAARADELFAQALASGAFEESDRLYGEVLALQPQNSVALANRGTLRLQNRRWREAAADLQRAVELDGGLRTAAPVAVNNLGNALGAVGDWTGALEAYGAAADARSARRDGLAEIARANAALALFQLSRTDEALRLLAAITRRDPEFFDARAATAAFLWSVGREADAEAAWQLLCTSGRGFGASRSAEDGRSAEGGAADDISYAGRLLGQQVQQQLGVVGMVPVRDNGDDTPCRLYRDVVTVSPRWPPRATAALDAFLKVARKGSATGYDGQALEFDFSAPALSRVIRAVG